MPKRRDANNGLCGMGCKSLMCVEIDSCELCRSVADKYLQTLKIIANIEQLLEELTRSTVTEKAKLEGTYSAMLFAATPLLTGLLGLAQPSNALLAGLQVIAATVLVTIVVKRAFSGEGRESAFPENPETGLEGTEPGYLDIEDLSKALNEFRKLASVYELILSRCAEKCDVRVGKEKTA
ncbi:MAG: hypothetical protein QXN25_04865 [Desulfurococcaceae archaeon]